MDAKAATDSVVEFAAQTGRLDFLTAVLAVLALMIAGAAFPLFFFLKNRAEEVARETAEAVMKGAEDKAEAAAVLRMEEMLPILVEEYRRLAENSVGAEDADRIAATFEEPEEAEEDQQQ